MVEQNKPVVSYPGQAPDTGENISGAGAGASGDTASTENGGDFVSTKAFEERMTKFESELQSRTDKAVTSIREKVNSINKTFSDMAETGVLTEEQKKSLEVKRTKAIADVVESSEDPDPNLPGAKAPASNVLPNTDGAGASETKPAAVAKVDPIVAAATEIMDEVGARIYEDDPEAEMLKTSRDKAEYLANAKIAATNKLARLNRDPASVGMTGGANQGSIMDIESNSAAWDEVKKTI